MPFPSLWRRGTVLPSTAYTASTRFPFFIEFVTSVIPFLPVDYFVKVDSGYQIHHVMREINSIVDAIIPCGFACTRGLFELGHRAVLVFGARFAFTKSLYFSRHSVLSLPRIVSFAENRRAGKCCNAVISAV